MTILKGILEARGSLLEQPGRGMGYGRMMHGGKCPYAGTVMKGECPGCTGVGTDLSMGAKDPMSEAVDEIDSADFKLNKAGKKTKAHKIVFRTGEDETQIKDDTTKVHEETAMKKTYKEFTEKYINTELDEAREYLAVHPKTDKVEHVSDSKEARDEFIKSKGSMHKAAQAMVGQKKVGDKYMREAYWPDPKHAVSAKPETGRITRTQHRVKTTDTGAIYTKEYDPAGISKGSGAAAAEPKRGRGRPKKDKFAESFAALLAMNETQFDMFAESLSEEAFDAFTAALKV